jgi:hypothetical protein
VTVGSVEGNGYIDTSYYSFAVGSNNLDTVFSGLILGVGSLTKVGEGRLVLTGTNTYTGINDPIAGTIVDQGTLLVNNTSGSGTGTGRVIVRHGILGGTGIIAGDVQVGSIISPGKKARVTGTLTIESALTIDTAGSYHFTVDTNGATADEIVANGATLIPGAQLAAVGVGAGSIAVGTTFTAISNSATTPISGTFSNLLDGGTLTIGNNTFQANYEGGDGNDLTLTVVP